MEASKNYINIISTNQHLWQQAYYLMPLENGTAAAVLVVEAFLVLVGSTAKHFHILRVSSAAPEMTVEPSGDKAIYSTRAVCPVNITSLCILTAMPKSKLILKIMIDCITIQEKVMVGFESVAL